MTNFPKLSWPDDFDPWDLQDMVDTGRTLAIVEVSESKKVEVQCLDLIRYSQLVMAAENSGTPCFYIKNLIVLPKLSEERIRNAIEYLYERGYFEHRI